jgi:hypothetical protein
LREPAGENFFSRPRRIPVLPAVLYFVGGAGRPWEQAMGDYQTGFEIAATPAKVYAAINDVPGWWTGDIDGAADRAGAEFTYRNKELHRSLQRASGLDAERRGQRRQPGARDDGNARRCARR